MFWWCIIMPSCSCYQSMDMLLFELYIHFNDAFFSLPPRVIIAKLTISLCHHDNSILISLRFRWEMFLKSFSTAHFYTDKPKNQRLWLSSLYNSKTKKKKKKVHRCHFRFWMHCFVYFRNQWILVWKLYRSLHFVNNLKAKKKNSRSPPEVLTIFDTVNTCSAIFYTSVVYQLFIFINQISYYLGVHCKQYIKRFLVYTVCCMSKVWFILSSNLVGNKAWNLLS